MKDKSKQRGFFMIANDILHHLPQLGLAGFLIYCILRRMTDRNDRCYPSLYGLSRMTGVDEEQIKDILTRLEALQLMSRLQHTNSLNGKQTEVYQLPLYPEGLSEADKKTIKPPTPAPGEQLSLYKPELTKTPIIPSIPDDPPNPIQVDDPPSALSSDDLNSLVKLLVEQMRETNKRMDSLLQRIDSVVA